MTRQEISSDKSAENPPGGCRKAPKRRLVNQDCPTYVQLHTCTEAGQGQNPPEEVFCVFSSWNKKTGQGDIDT